MSSTGVLQRILAGFAAALQPVQAAVSSPDAFAAFLKQFGWTLAPADLAHVSASAGGLSSLSSDPSSLSLEDLASELIDAGTAIRRISSSGAPAAFASTFPRELLDYLVYSALAQQSAPFFGLLHFVGVLAERRVPADPATGRVEYTERQVQWDRLGGLADDPVTTIREAYGWGSAFDADAFLRSTGILIRAFGGNASLVAPDRHLVEEYYARGAPDAARQRNLIVSVPELTGSVSGPGASAGAKLAFLAIGIPPSPTAAAPVDGLALMPVITGQAADSIALSDTASLALSGDFLTRPVRAELHPDSAVVRATPGDVHVDAKVRLDAKAPQQTPWLAFGDVNSSRLEIAASHASLALSGQVDGDLDLKVEVGLDSAALIVDLGEGDGFVKDVAGSRTSRSPLSLVLSWSSKSGLSLGGQPRLGVTIPVDESLAGVVHVTAVGFALGGADGAIAFDATLTFTAALGPFVATFNEAGVRTLLRPVGDAGPPGNLGNVDVQFGFKPPSGVGVAVDAGIVSGGGYLGAIDDGYAGVLELKIADVAVKAYGLVQTKLPGNVPGYSFVAVISAEFSPPFELSFGFTLDGVGGLLGVNRTIAEDAVESALWAHHLDGLLFPKDPIATAPQLISALQSYFPAAGGRYIFGPMAKIGWGEGIAVGDVALILELPEPLKLLLVGEVAVGVPVQHPQLELHVSFAGGLDLGKKLAFFDATLHDSRIAGYPITGDLAFRYDWGDQPVLAFSLGGFHPHFQPPANFPALKRLAITIGSSVAQLETQAYIAITSNTLQFGARVELTAGTGSFNVHGWLAFDALCEKHPLSIAFDLSAGVDLRHGTSVLASVHLEGHLTGPTPWHIAGEASLSLFFFDITVHFDKTWGSIADVLATLDPLPELVAALANRSSWNGALPPGWHAVVTTVAAPPDAGELVLLDPSGSLRIGQKAAPLGRPITRFGGAPLGRTLQFTIDNLNVFGGGVGESRPTTEEFAPAQFFEFSDAEKLSLPSFSNFDAGVEIGHDAVDVGQSPRTRAVVTPLVYDTTIVDSLTVRRRGAEYVLGAATLLALDGSAGGPQPGLDRYRPPPGVGPRVVLAPDRWVVAGSADLALEAAVGDDGTKLGAQLALSQYLSANPDKEGQLQVVLAGETA